MVLESRGFQPLYKRVRSVGLRVKDKQEVGGVYEYQSEDGSPPPELAALFGVKKKRSSSKSSEKVYTPRKPREKNYKSEKERRIEKRMRKETQAEARKTGVRRGPAETTNDLDSLENELLGKYGAKEYREVLEAGWCAALDSWAQVGDVDKVLSVMRAMEARGLMLNRIHWTIAIKAACRSGDAGGCARALKLLQEHVRGPEVV